MLNNESIDKIIQVYFSHVTREPFSYQDGTYYPKRLVISPLVFRGFTCPSGCGGCCKRVTLNWLPNESKPDNVQSRIVTLNSKGYLVFTDLQDDHSSYHCRNLRFEDGRCNIYPQRPMPCDLELTKFIQYTTGGNHGLLTTKLFGRGWSNLRVDGIRGAKCEMLPVSIDSKNELIRKLLRLKEWTDYFELVTCLPRIIDWCISGPHVEPLTIHKNTI